MLFNSFEFVIFFLVTTFLFFAIPPRARWFLLLIASSIFYMAFIPSYILILGFTIVVDYCAGILIEGATGRKRTLFLMASLVANIGVLAIFKYYGFLADNLALLTHWLHIERDLPMLNIVLPIGLSFHTFQAMSYTIEVYRGHQKADRHFGVYSLYVMFYPQLVAGPIERPQNLLPQLHHPKAFEYWRVAAGLRLILWGIIKKAVIADQLAQVVNMIYAKPQDYSGPFLVLATFFFAIQIYCDFSGYSDIAIGCAKLMGYDLMTNFRFPYFATSIADFWRRWHISLSTWFRDYVYIPLGGSRVATPRRYFNIMTVFLLSGLWHGAAWTFIIWGALHGAYLVLEVATQPWREAALRHLGLQRAPTLLRVLHSLMVFLLVLIAWVFFRARSIDSAILILTHMLSWEGFQPATFWRIGLDRFEMMIALMSIGLLFVVDFIRESVPKPIEVLWARQWFRWATYLCAVYSVIFFGFFGRVEFIYFQF